MPRKYVYQCTKCHRQPGDTREEARKNLIVKRIQFAEYGFKGRLLRSRIVEWLCGNCARADDDWSMPENEVSERMAK